MFGAKATQPAWLSLLALGTRSGGIALVFGSNIVLARLLGSAHYGVYSFGCVIASIGAVIAMFGFGSSSVRYLPAYLREEDYPRQRGFVLLNAGGAVVTGLFSGGCVCLVSLLVSDLDLRGIAVPVGALIAVLCVAGALTEVMRALTWSIHAIAFSSLIVPVISAASAYVLYLSTGLDAKDGLWVAVGSNVVGLLLQAATFWRRINRGAFATAAPRFEFRRWISTGLPITFAFAVSLLAFYCETAVVAYFLPSADLGVYRAVSQVCYILAFVPATIYSAIGGVLSGQHNDVRAPEFFDTIWKVHRVVAGCVVVMAITVSCFAKSVLATFGVGFESGSLALAIMCVGASLRVALGPSDLLLTLSDRQQARLAVELAVFVLSVVAGIILVPYFGIIGAAAANVVTTVTAGVWLHAIVARSTSIAFLWKRSRRDAFE